MLFFFFLMPGVLWFAFGNEKIKSGTVVSPLLVHNTVIMSTNVDVPIPKVPQMPKVDHGMENARSMIPYLTKFSDKYEVVYFNTPWSKLDLETIAKFPVDKISSDNSALFLWVDSYSLDKGMHLLDSWGFKFHSVFQVVDVAQYPWMKKEKPVVEVNESETEPTPKVRHSPKKTRAPPINPPKWWGKSPESPCGSRPSIEQLWLATKGDVSSLFNSGSVAYQVVNLPELGKKSRAKKSLENEWDVERPTSFLETVLGHLSPSRNVLNVFASSMQEKVDSWGPGLPGGFLDASMKSTGLVGEINKTMRSLKKTQLQALSGKCVKYLLGTDDAEKKSILDDISESWQPVAMCAENVKASVAYNLKTDAGIPADWFVALVQTLASKNVTDFSSLRKKRKKRRGPTDANRPRHGIASASRVSKELAEFLNMDPEEKIARTAVVSRLNEYIAKNGLQNPENKLQILLDEPLKKLLKPPPGFEPVTYFNLCKLFGSHFPKKTDGENAKKVKVG